MKPFVAIFVDLNALRTIVMKTILDSPMMEIPVQIPDKSPKKASSASNGSFKI
jgi:hypothetical protein